MLKCMTVSGWLAHATTVLTGSDNARLDAEMLLAVTLGQTRTSLYTWPDAVIDAVHMQSLELQLRRRATSEPLAYLLGEREFWSLTLEVNHAVLVPRPETEHLVEYALQMLDEDACGPILEAGTGTGAIAIALARERRIPVVASDICIAALAVAQRNVARHAAGLVSLVQAHWLAPFSTNSMGMIISNPPYLAANDPHLDNSELSHEPRQALVSGKTGLDALAQLIDEATRVGKPHCRVILEHGFQQGAAVRELMAQHAFDGITTLHDLAGLDRLTTGCCPA
jgi:release factor glutamine methyltransferase